MKTPKKKFTTFCFIYWLELDIFKTGECIWEGTVCGLHYNRTLTGTDGIAAVYQFSYSD